MRHQEHVRYLRTNNPTSADALHTVSILKHKQPNYLCSSQPAQTAGAANRRSQKAQADSATRRRSQSAQQAAAAGRRSQKTLQAGIASRRSQTAEPDNAARRCGQKAQPNGSASRRSQLNIAFRATSTVQQLTEKQTRKNLSEIYKLQCNIRNNVYVGQSGRSINVRYKEHVRYIRTNNPTSAYALHILQNKHDCGAVADTIIEGMSERHLCELLGSFILYILIIHQRKVLITEQ